MRTYAILRIVTKLLIPYILLFALYVQFHGDFGPGGGFQAGVIFAAGIILYALVFGLKAARQVAPPAVIEVLIATGVLMFAGTGFVTMFLGGNFLDYDVLERHVEEPVGHVEVLDRRTEESDHHAQISEPHVEESDHSEGHGFLPHGQHLGIFVVELGVGITVAAVMISIFFSFAGRERVE